MNFIKGQKVICIKSDFELSIQEGDICTVSDIEDHLLELDTRYWYKYFRFKTIIQSIEDIIVGMTLTHKDYGKCTVVIASKYLISVQYTDNPVQSHYYDISVFEEYQPKEKEEIMKSRTEPTKYTVPKAFSLKDLWDAFSSNHNCSEFQVAWSWLLGDFEEEKNQGWTVNCEFIAFSKNCVPKTMWNHRKELEEVGLIKRIEKEIVLKPGIKLKIQGSEAIWTVVSDQCGYFLLSNGKILFNITNGDGGYPLRIKEGGALNELKKVINYNVEVIED